MTVGSPLLAQEQFHQSFPALVNKTYLNFGGQGPLAAVASEAITSAFARFSEVGPFSQAAGECAIALNRQLRVALATQFGTTPDRIALTESTTAGMNVPLWGVDWQAGDRLVLSDAEHYGIWQIGYRLRERFGIELVECPLARSADPVSVLASYMTPTTKVVAISHVVWNSGRLLPLAELADCCHAHNALLVSDAAQSAGVVPVDLPATQVDCYAFTGHKWFCGPAGVGAVYMSQAAQERIRTTYTGWCGHYATDGANRYEVATASYPLRAGFTAAIALHDTFASMTERFAWQVQRAHSLWEQLQRLDGVTCLSSTPPDTGLVAFTVAGCDPAEVEATLEARQIFLRAMPDPVCLRASVHYVTTADDIARVVEAIAHIAA